MGESECPDCGGSGYYVPRCFVGANEPLGTRHSQINCTRCNPDCLTPAELRRRDKRQASQAKQGEDKHT